MRRLLKGLIVVGIAAMLVYVANASWAFGSPGRAILVSHLGMAQNFDERGLTMFNCKADRMRPPIQPYPENTIASVGKAFALGADVANITIHPTSDGDFVIFHDWIVDCRTDGHGVTRELPLAVLKKLDIGYRLTADGGRTYPFRGKFVGAMPTLGEMLAAFPGRSFMLVIKSDDPSEGDRLLAYLKLHHEDLRHIMVFGGDRPVARLHQLAPHLLAGSEGIARACLTRYLAIGWTGIVPASCRDTIVPVPFNYRRLAWGWPNLMVKRMARVNSVVLLIGPYERHSDRPGMNFIDTEDQLAALPRDFAGQIFTTRIDVVGPAARARFMLRQSNSDLAPSPTRP
ncbi:MAG: glycerophosphodiester phosphodiesterase [Alphaproteobacteria bacterium]|nr:glycerophosphodiester phosphodiesterase [Alphaproteobacteria bacterium]